MKFLNQNELNIYSVMKIIDKFWPMLIIGKIKVFIFVSFKRKNVETSNVIECVIALTDLVSLVTHIRNKVSFRPVSCQRLPCNFILLRNILPTKMLLN